MYNGILCNFCIIQVVRNVLNVEFHVSRYRVIVHELQQEVCVHILLYGIYYTNQCVIQSLYYNMRAE